MIDTDPRYFLRHEFVLYKGGATDKTTTDNIPVFETHMYAKEEHYLDYSSIGRPFRFLLSPVYGAANHMYEVNLSLQESLEPGWLTARAQLTINTTNIGGREWRPLTWYVGSPTDWSTGLVRFPEISGAWNITKPGGEELPRQVWTLGVRRNI